MGRFGVAVAAVAGLGVVAGLLVTAPATSSAEYPPDPSPTATATSGPAPSPSATPTATATPTPTPTPTPTETFLPEPPPDGGATVTIGGGTASATVSLNEATGTMTVVGPEFQVIVDPKAPNGADLPADANGALIVNIGADIASSGRGFVPRSPVNFYLLSGQTAIFLGTLTVFSDGTFAGSVPVPRNLASGPYLLQVNGLTNATRLRAAVTQVISISLNVVVEEPTAEAKAVRTLVYFDVLSAKLNKASKRQLDKLVPRLPRKVDNLVRIVGFVGPSPTTANNKSLSRARAKSVERYLRAKGVRGTYRVRGAGLAPQSGPGARRANVLIVPSPGR